MNREPELNKTFPLEDGTTYIQSLDNFMCEYSGLPSTQSYAMNTQIIDDSLKENFKNWMLKNDTAENAEKYFHYTDEDMFNEYLNELKGAGVGGESIKENFIDSDSIDSLTKEQYDILYDIVYKDTERLVINEYNKIIDDIHNEQSKSASVDKSPISLESPNNTSASVDSSIDWMYNWIKKHKNR